MAQYLAQILLVQDGEPLSACPTIGGTAELAERRVLKKIRYWIIAESKARCELKPPHVPKFNSLVEVEQFLEEYLGDDCIVCGEIRRI